MNSNIDIDKIVVTRYVFNKNKLVKPYEKMYREDVSNLFDKYEKHFANGNIATIQNLYFVLHLQMMKIKQDHCE